MMDGLSDFTTPRAIINDIVLLSTAVTAIYAGRKPFTTWWSVQRARKAMLDALPIALNKIQDDVQAIRHEVTFNGGSSLKDVVRENGYRVSLEVASRRLTSEHATWEGRVRSADSGVEPEFVSQAWTRLTGMSSAETADGGWAQCVASEDRARVLQIAQTANEKQELFQTEYTVVNVLTGKRTRVSHIGRPLFDAAGMLYGWVGLMTPIEEKE